MDYYSLLLANKLNGGGGSSTTVEPLSVTENGTYTAPSGKAYSPVRVDVPVGWTTDGIAQGLEPNGDIVLGDEVTTIAKGAFAYKPVTSISNSKITKLGESAFLESDIQRVNLPSVNSFINGRQFGNCTSLISVSLQSLTINTAGYMFDNCSALKYVALPSWNNASFTGYGNRGWSSIEIIDFGKSGIKLWNAPSSYPLHTIIIRGTTVLSQLTAETFEKSTAFQNGGTGGEVYIPEVMFNHLGDGSSLDYKSATNWATFDAYATITWKKLEGSQFESFDWAVNLT